MHILLLRLLLAVTSVFGHIRLINPPARYPSFDYLEASRTKPPCGIPRQPNGTITWLRSGQPVNVTWFQAVPHSASFCFTFLVTKIIPIEREVLMGTFRVELLNDLDQLFTVLSSPPSVESKTKFDKSALGTSVQVMIPENFECLNCVMRVVREANEYSKQYLFYSCADVNIVNEIPDGGTCLGNGIREAGLCQCSRLSHGDNCQFKDECWEDIDCGSHGKCIGFSDQAVPRKQCFCEKGYFGQACDHETKSISSDSEFNPTLYQMREVNSDKDRIYWRILKDEIEMVAKFKSSSWVAVGWKSKQAVGVCGPMDELQTRPPISSLDQEVTKAPAIGKTMIEGGQLDGSETSDAQAGQSSTTLGNLNRSPEDMCSENEEYSNCPEYTRQCEASCDWTRFPETIPNCPRTCGTPKCICKEGHVRASNDNDSCVLFSFCSDEFEIDCPTNSTWAKCGIACEPTCENMYDTSPCPATCDQPACTCADNYVRHNQNCIFWGDCPNLEQRLASQHITVAAGDTATIIDAQSSRSVPEESTTESTSRHPVTERLTCGINETISECGRACEPTCSNIYSRSRCEQCYPVSCRCIQGYTRNEETAQCIYWGDCPLKSRSTNHVAANRRVNIAEAVAETNSSSSSSELLPQDPSSSSLSVNTNSLNSSDLAADGTLINDDGQPSQKLQTPSNSFGDVCYGEWRWPKGCRDCDYRISWSYLDDTDEIEFSIETRAPSNWWTGIGFSPTGTMVEADMIVVKSQNGKLSLHDMYSTQYGIPREDSKQNVYTPTIVGTHVNGVLRAQFTRKRDTGDRKADHHFTDNNCYKFLFPVSGGRLDENGQMLKHINTPQVSENNICIQSCTAPQDLRPINSCETEYRYPTGCEHGSCDYVAKWEYNAARKDVRFEISAKELGRWTGIGLSRDGSMTNSDIYTGWVYEGKAYVTDRFAYGHQLPTVDPADRQDIYEITGKTEDDVQTISFRRKVLPADTITDFPLNKCYYFLFPIGGGRVLARKSNDFKNAKTAIGYHDLYQPRVSRNKICICDQNGISIAPDGEPPAVRSRREANNRQESESLRLNRRQVQDPFEIQVDPFGPRKEQLQRELELDYPIEEKILRGEGVSAPAHISLNGTNLSTATVISQSATTSDSVPLPSADVNPENASDMKLSSGDSGSVSIAESSPQLDHVTEPDTSPKNNMDVSETLAAIRGSDSGSNAHVLEPMTSAKMASGKTSSEITATPSQDHPMDCTDMVIGMVVNGVSQVRDYYSFSRATPRPDNFFGGQNSLTSAIAYQEDGMTTLIFRKPLKASELADNSVEHGASLLLWAKGVDQQNYIHTTGNAIFEDDLEGASEFFPSNVLKFHGKNNRGRLVVDFYDEQKWTPKPNIKAECSGTFAHPSGCTGDQCKYDIAWSTDGKKISFSLTAELALNHWTGIGFSMDGSMARSDIIVVSVPEESHVDVIDMYSPSYNRPKTDDDQGVFDIRAVYSDGVVYANFSRFLVSDDSNDLSIDQCVYFIYPVSSGMLDAEGKEIRKHLQAPISSSRKICPISCAHASKPKKIPINEPLLKSSILPDELIETSKALYDLVLRITNRQWEPRLATRSTEEFHQMSADVINTVHAMLNPKYPAMKIIEIKKFSKGSVLAHLTLLSNDIHPPSEDTLVAYLDENQSQKATQMLHFQTESVVMRKLRRDRSMRVDQMRNWIMLGVGSTLFLMATFIVCCMISRSRKGRAIYNTYPPQYPLNGYGYNTGVIGSAVHDKKGFENAAYQASHTRQFSQATTASQNGTGKGSPNVATEESPKGVGETTYQEWFSKVASKPGAQQHEEASLSPAGNRPPSTRPSTGGAPNYLSYSQEPGAYFSFNGENRLQAPGYYRPF